ncbi:methyltransferase domain-containing protein [Clostridium aestuarii]|uniref:Methyltransferase domain-containing protein n=1 Tax=Clostridium aestuarii TaxID=338193 RepID=A0ABT4D3D8_9CLOT|nr:class I SAM-dependent methyltransferase [Clostridium aestuarii]MCY6485754.1 methyltransferase domain-containing protein [Clostridium aestuarii]
MKWSKYFQNPTYLEMTRKFMLNQDLKPLIVKYLGIESGMEVLDVGCGTGAFTRYLVEELLEESKKCEFTGIDYDEKLIEVAKQYVSEKISVQDIKYIIGNAYKLPFDNNKFDLIVSHTFLGIASDVKTALNEMIRVVKPGGSIASVTSMSYGHQAWHEGYYPEKEWRKELSDLADKIIYIYERVHSTWEFVLGKPSSEIPHFFAESGLKNVRIYGLGRVFSLSNAAMSKEEKEEYIIGMYEAEVCKFKNYWEIEEFRKYLTKQEKDKYLSLLNENKNFLLKNIGENIFWDWHGGANLLVIGDVVKNK